ncbi:hypothetical protein BC829DRAFT_88527 [Chytridium lagenaria]|nr:hypothetical protein BC829DRAFT_88527 [Chytridium lagenaria]
MRVCIFREIRNMSYHQSRPLSQNPHFSRQIHLSRRPSQHERPSPNSPPDLSIIPAQDTIPSDLLTAIPSQHHLSTTNLTTDNTPLAPLPHTTLPTTLVTKFVVVQHLLPGDHFYDGDSSKTPRELYLASGLGVSASRTSIIANLKTEILRIAKLDFNKFATKKTWREFVEKAGHAVPPIERLSEAYMEKRDWEVFKRKMVEEVVRRVRNGKKVDVAMAAG